MELYFGHDSENDDDTDPYELVAPFKLIEKIQIEDCLIFMYHLKISTSLLLKKTKLYSFENVFNEHRRHNNEIFLWDKNMSTNKGQSMKLLENPDVDDLLYVKFFEPMICGNLIHGSLLPTFTKLFKFTKCSCKIGLVGNGFSNKVRIKIRASKWKLTYEERSSSYCIITTLNAPLTLRFTSGKKNFYDHTLQLNEYLLAPKGFFNRFSLGIVDYDYFPMEGAPGVALFYGKYIFHLSFFLILLNNCLIM